MMKQYQNDLLLGLSLLVLAAVDWKTFIFFCAVLLFFVVGPVLLFLLLLVIRLLYFAIAFSITYIRGGAAKIRTWLFS